MFLRIPRWLIILIFLLLASVIAERAKAETLAPDAAGLVTQPLVMPDSAPAGMFGLEHRNLQVLADEIGLAPKIRKEIIAADLAWQLDAVMAGAGGPSLSSWRP